MGIKLALNRFFGGGVNGQAKLARAAQIASSAFSEADSSKNMEEQEAARLRQLAEVAELRAEEHSTTADRARKMAKAAHE